MASNCNPRPWPPISGVADAHSRQCRGKGVVIGVLDTGIASEHPEFRRHRIEYVFIPEDFEGGTWLTDSPSDSDGHGTHVCGILAGENVGVAPEAELYVAEVIESSTVLTSLRRVIYGLQWFLRQLFEFSSDPIPRAVLNMSLGFESTEMEDTSAPEYFEYQGQLESMQQLLRELMTFGVLPVCAIGNEGLGQYRYPGAFPEVLGVGAVDDDLRIWRWSGSRNSPTDPIKPDLVGFGVAICSSMRQDDVGEFGYTLGWGTSLASAYVSGLAALYRSLHPTETALQIKDRLCQNAVPLPRQLRGPAGTGLAVFR